MVAKIDEAEILSPLRRLVLITGCIYWLIMTAVGILLYRHLDLRRNVEVRREQDLEAATRDLNLRDKRAQLPLRHFLGRRAAQRCAAGHAGRHR